MVEIIAKGIGIIILLFIIFMPDLWFAWIITAIVAYMVVRFLLQYLLPMIIEFIFRRE